MKTLLTRFSGEVLSKEQMKQVLGGGTPTIPGSPTPCWCPGAGKGTCIGGCNEKGCGGREGCFPYN